MKRALGIDLGEARIGVAISDAEDDGLLVAVAALFEKLGDSGGDELGAVINHQDAVVIFGVVDAVFDFLAIAVRLARLGAVALHIHVNVDLDDFVGREEAVANALLEGVGDIGGHWVKLPLPAAVCKKASKTRRSWVTVEMAEGSIVRKAFTPESVGALATAADVAEDRVVETFATVVDIATLIEVVVEVTVETLTAADDAVLWSTVAVESAVLRTELDRVAEDRSVLSDVRCPATPVPIAIESTELDRVAEDRLALIAAAAEAAPLMLDDSDVVVLSTEDVSMVVVDRDPDVLRKSSAAVETCAEVGDAPSPVRVESAADSDTLVLVTLLRSTVTVLRLVLVSV